MTDDVAVHSVDYFLARGTCLADDRCRRLHGQFQSNLLNKYVMIPGQKPSSQHILACIPLTADALNHVDVSLKSIHKGAGARQARKGDGLYDFHEFSWNDFVSDIECVNRSKQVRSGGEMRSGYLKASHELRDRLPWPIGAGDVCPLHWVRSFGAFTHPTPEHQSSGSLVAYVRVKRHGQIFSYSQILGHGDHLSKGVMYGLHRFIVETLVDELEPMQNIILYNRWNSGGSGLQQWKKRNGFLPSYVHYVDGLESGRRARGLRKLITKRS